MVSKKEILRILNLIEKRVDEIELKQEESKEPGYVVTATMSKDKSLATLHISLDNPDMNIGYVLDAARQDEFLVDYILSNLGLHRQYKSKDGKCVINVYAARIVNRVELP